MPNVLLDRISLPNLRLYTSVSVLLVSCCIYYAITSTADPFWRLDNNATTSESFFTLNAESLIGVNSGVAPDDHHHHHADNILVAALKKAVSADGDNAIAAESATAAAEWNGDADEHQQQQQQNQLNSKIFSFISPDQRKLFNDTRTIGNKFKDVVYFMMQEPICIWVSRKIILHTVFRDWSRGEKKGGKNVGLKHKLCQHRRIDRSIILCQNCFSLFISKTTISKGEVRRFFLKNIVKSVYLPIWCDIIYKSGLPPQSK